MTDPKSEKFKKDNILYLEEIRDKFSLHTDIFLANLLDEWQSVETISFIETPEPTEHKYENPGFIQTAPNYNRSNTPTPIPKVYKLISDDTNRPPVLPPRVPESRQLPHPPASGPRSPVQKNFPPLPPTYTNTVLRPRDPYPNYPDKNRPWPHRENIEVQHNLKKDHYQQETLPIVPPFESKQLYHEIDPMGIFGEGKTIIHESIPKSDDVDRFYVKEDRPPFPPPYRPDYNPHNDTNGHQMRAKRSHSVDILNTKPEIPPRSVIDTTQFNSDRRLEPKPGDPEYTNCVTHTPRTNRTPVSSDVHKSSGVIPADNQMHRQTGIIPVDSLIHRPPPGQVVLIDNQMHRPPPSQTMPVDNQMYRPPPSQTMPVDNQMYRPPPSQTMPVDNQMYRPPPSQTMPVDNQIHRPPPSQVVLIDNQMQRAVNARSTGVIPSDTHVHRHTGDIIPVSSELHRPSALIVPKYPRMLSKEYDGGQPMKTSDEYLVMFGHSDEERKDTQQQVEGKGGEDSSMGVFNLKEMISERTETIIDEQGYRKRKVITEKTSSQEEANFYDTIANHSVFYLYLTEQNILTQEVLALEHPIGTVLTEKLSPYYSLNLSNSIITLGAQVGLLEVNDRINQGPQKLEAFLKKFTGKRKVPLDPSVSLHQINVTTSHVICISQQSANFDENSYNFYLEEREQNLVEHFHRAFIPFIQGAIPLKKVNVKNLISYLGVIYKLKDWEKMIPDVYKNDPEMNAHIEPSIKLCFESSPDEIMPQVIKLAQESRLRESIYFYVKINNKIDRKSRDSVLGINKRNIHLLGMARNCEIEIATMWSSVDVETWTVPANKEIVIKFKDESRLQLVSPEHSEDMIHKMLKSGIKCKIILDIK